MNRLLLISTIIILVSCRGQEYEDKLLSCFDGVPACELTSDVAVELDQYGVLSPKKIVLYKGSYIIKKTKAENFLDVLTTDGAVISCVKKGRGPGELVDIGSFQVQGDTLFVFGRSQKKLLVIDIPGTIASQRQQILEEKQIGLSDMSVSEQMAIPVFLQLSNNRIYATGMFGDNSLYVELSPSGVPISGISGPALEDNKIDDMAQRVLNASSVMSISPDGARIAVAYNQIAALSFANTEPKLMERWSRVFFQPSLWHPDNVTGVVVGYNRDDISTFHDLQAFNDNVYVLYSGKNHEGDNEEDPSHCNYLLVFDWDGNPLKKYELENAIVGFHVDGNILYGVSSSPSARVLQFRLR